MATASRSDLKDIVSVNNKIFSRRKLGARQEHHQLLLATIRFLVRKLPGTLVRLTGILRRAND
ncbi:hypothetical protein JSU15_23255 (plasmid) [Escherichia coli O7:H4]|uniref:hypothetical protein n=1 Tax=Escherichia coli TaxID=562 RepID=UPI001AAF581E|nr:hypothetical protein [Escherichia coli]QTF24169.1 hypothetical protein JSU15_23255 [Escherichia coli O7:H4]